MEGLFNVLKNYQHCIQKGLINYKKCPKDRITVEYIESRQELLENDWVNFRESNSKLHENYQLKELGQDINNIYETTEDTYVTYKCLLKTMLKKISISKELVQNNSSISKSGNSCVRLPKISIPIFSGKYAEWTTFHDLFISLVHKNDSLDNVQKLHYLKSHLNGEAEQLIRHTPVTDSNYNQCWVQLEKRYSNKKYLANCILKRLFGQKKMYLESASLLKELLDTTNDCLNALKNLSIDVSTWDVIIIHIVTYKLDPETRKHWELSVSTNESNDLPSFEQFKLFIENRFRALECIEPNKGIVHQVRSSQTHNARAMFAMGTTNMRCEYCSDGHKLCFCKKFAKQSIDHRRQFVAKNKICFNCLGSNHTVYDCKKQTKCRICQRRHHSLLHPNEGVEDNQSVKPITTNAFSSAINVDPVVSCVTTGNVLKPRQILLATALIEAQSKTGGYQLIRALLDQGSQACFITEATVQYLNLKKIPIEGTISGIGDIKSTIAKHMVNLKIRSRISSEDKLEVTAYVLKKITSYLPERSILGCSFDWINSKVLQLADPDFITPNKIDILLGAEAYSCIMKEGIIKNPTETLIAQCTTLGWILSGAVGTRDSERSSAYTARNISVMHAQFGEDEGLKKFWEIEEIINTKKILTVEEKKCEELYNTTTTRRHDGRYVIRLPLKEQNPPCKYGSSRAIAENRFKSLERRFNKNPDLKEKYTDVINEYLLLGHMRPVKENDHKKGEAVYLPHHAVIRNDKLTTKVRVVFNASEKNSKGVSLNDTLMVGPTIQADLRHTVLKWRVYPIAMTADIIKMYRQIRVHDEDVIYQRILWRDSVDKEIKDYELMTVTFGTASAPYQAVRTLHQIVYDEGERYPLAAEKILNSFYMDDLMTGCQSVEEGINIYKQISELLGKAGFLLQKWVSNNSELLGIIHSLEIKKIKGQTDHKWEMENKNQDKYNRAKDKENNLVHVNLKDTSKIKGKEPEIKLDNIIKILGLTWNSSEDFFQYIVNLPSVTMPVTKRTVISDIARLFDPLGWLAPSVVLAKIFIQKLWLADVGWDEELSNELIKEWCTYRNELSLLTQIRIPRWLGTKNNDNLELHGFCDASKAAYSAVIYLRIVDFSGKVQLSLVVSKTRVAPIKQVSIPRLELCGAVLLSKLLAETGEVLNISQDSVRAWTDSTVVLAWLSSHPSRWKTFVANRTSEILTTMRSSQWFHVSTKENPADCASRGVLPSQLVEDVLWFLGPQFLKERNIIYKRPKDLPVNLEDSVKANLVTVPEESIMERFSSLQRLLRVIAYCRRFLNKRRNETTYLQKNEIDKALEICIRKTQQTIFTKEFTQLHEKGYLHSKSSKLKSLTPFIDDNGILRVEGRLDKSLLEHQTKHPIILPSSSHLTNLIVADAHSKTLHGGPQLMMNYLRTAYWILGIRNIVKHYVRKCVTCVRHKASVRNQKMGSLPSVRCTPARPFLHSGVDYAGPINIRTAKGRGHRSHKGYISLFVCMSTRAIHLELVSDMSTETFLAAFRRFVSRRGHCAKIFSDNGTTFVGASKELRQLASIQPSIAEHLEANGTEWHFIPPHSPHFGRLWEAGVKSTKFHLKRVIGESTLTYEEMTTLLSQVESCLNSRPLSVINSTDPDELLPLTPGHFLIGEPIVSVPDVQRMLQSFWRRWSQEYLCNLMNRYKWSTQVPEPKIGDVVLIKEDDLPPSRWLLGRVTQKHPGDDNISRVITLRTKSATIKRPTCKVCILPIID